MTEKWSNLLVLKIFRFRFISSLTNRLYYICINFLWLLLYWRTTDVGVQRYTIHHQLIDIGVLFSAKVIRPTIFTQIFYDEIRSKRFALNLSSMSKQLAKLPAHQYWHGEMKLWHRRFYSGALNALKCLLISSALIFSRENVYMCIT